jgi:hypothetical protein
MAHPHANQEPTALVHLQGGDVNRRGYGQHGEVVWIHGPEPLGPRGGKRWAIRTRSLTLQRDQTRIERAKCWDGGCCMYRTRAEAIEAFRARTDAPTSGRRVAPPR